MFPSKIIIYLFSVFLSFSLWSDKPNVVFILLDDMGYSDIGCYGGEIETPNIDSLAAGGMRFTQMHNTSKCFPSRAALLTGLYAQQCGFGHYFKKFKHAVTLAEVLKSVGYRTFASGKHHSEESLYDRGFDHCFGLLDGATNHFNPGFQREGEEKPIQKKYGQRRWAIDQEVLIPYTPVDKDFYSTDIYTKYALKYLEKCKEDNSPFFLYLSYTAPHDPLQAWEVDIQKYEETYKKGYEFIRNARYDKMSKLGVIDRRDPLSYPIHKSWTSLSANQQKAEARRMAVYAAMIDSVDQNIGKIIKKLDAIGKRENTIVFFASDNGASSETPEFAIHKAGSRAGDGLPVEVIGSSTYWASQGPNWANVSNTPFRSYKNSSYEGGICTPFIVSWPNEIKNPGTINKDYPAHFIDIMATLIDATGAKYPTKWNEDDIKPYEGESLLPILLENGSHTRSKPIFWQWNRGMAVREGKWKAVAQNNQWELFNMEEDFTETKNLDDQHPEILHRLKSLHWNWLSNCR